MDEWREGGKKGRGRIGNTSCSDVICAADSYHAPGGGYGGFEASWGDRGEQKNWHRQKGTIQALLYA